MISVTALLLVLVILFALWQTIPFTFHRADVGTETETHDYFLPAPASVIYQGYWTHHFSEEDQKKLLEVFDLIFGNWEFTSAIKGETTSRMLRSYMKRYGALEFRYSAKRVCPVAPKGWGSTAECDAVWVFLKEGEPYIVRVRSGSARGSVLGLCGLPHSVGQEYVKILKEVFSNYSFQTAEWLKAS